jgi:hypothetical protein
VAEAKPAALTAEGLQAPHGGKLVNLLVPAEEQAALVASTTTTLELSDRNACDVELLTVGCAAPHRAQGRGRAARACAAQRLVTRGGRGIFRSGCWRVWGAMCVNIGATGQASPMGP